MCMQHVVHAVAEADKTLGRARSFRTDDGEEEEQDEQEDADEEPQERNSWRNSWPRNLLLSHRRTQQATKMSRWS